MRRQIVSPYRQLIYRLTTTLLVAWMAIFAPATCLHHGLLLRVLPAPSADGPAPHDHAAMMAHGEHGQGQPMNAQVDQPMPAASSTLAPMLYHQTLGGETSIMVLLAMAMPTSLPLPLPRPTMIWVESDEDPVSTTIPPPIRPPRPA